MKRYKFKVTVIKAGIAIDNKAELTVDDDFTMESIKRFEKDFRKALSEIRKAVIAHNYLIVEFTVSTYDHWLEDGKELIQKDFDYWTFNGFSDDTKKGFIWLLMNVIRMRYRIFILNSKTH